MAPFDILHTIHPVIGRVQPWYVSISVFSSNVQAASVSPLWPPQWRPYSQATSASDVDRAMSMSYSAMTPSKGKYFSYPVFLKIKKPCQESPSSYHSQVLAGSASVFFNSGHYGTPPSALSRCPDHLQLIGQTPYMPRFLPEKTVSLSLMTTSGMCSACAWVKLEMQGLRS